MRTLLLVAVLTVPGPALPTLAAAPKPAAPKPASPKPGTQDGKADGKARPAFKAGTNDVTFEKSPPHGAEEELRARLGVRDGKIGAYDVTKEKFRTWVPKTYSHAEEWGLLVWVDPGNGPGLPAAWEAVLAKHKLLAVSAHNSGNNRDVFDRFRLAIDGNWNMQQRFRIDPRRVYIAGFSGGGRVSSFLAVSYADIFAGAICVCGVNFHTDIVGPSGKGWRRNFAPPEEVLKLAKPDSRFVLITGEKDFNRENTAAVYEDGFRKEGYSHAVYLEVPGMAHSVPGAEWAERAIKFLDDPKSEREAVPAGKAGKK